MNVLEIMECTGIVPVFYNGDMDTAASVVRACYKGGIRAFEFTNRGEMAFDVFTALVEMTARECPDLVLGIGSITDAESCRKFIKAGAKFVVSPLFSSEVLSEARSLNTPYIPGAATPTEIFNAHRAGAQIVKVFPAAELGGPSFIKAVLAPMPWLRIMVTGGVDPSRENLTGWFAAGVKCVGIGSNLFPKSLAEAEISKNCAAVIETIKELRR